MNRKFTKSLLSLLIGLLLSLSTFGQDKVKDQIIGDWKGALSVQGQEMPLVFHFLLNEEKELISTIDSPLQNGFNIPMGKVTLEEKEFKINATDLGATYEGVLKNDSTLTGKWLQGGMSFDLIIIKEKKEKQK